MFIKNALKRIKKALYLIIFLIKVIIISRKSHIARQLINSLKESVYNVLTNNERQQINKIEVFRRSLNSSKKEIQLVDFGAGKSNIKPSQNIMNEGRRIKTKVNIECRTKSKAYNEALLLFKIVRYFQPEKCLELGTGLGISGAYIGTALELNSCGHLHTLEGSKSLVKIAKSVYLWLQLTNIDVVEGRFQDCLVPVLKKERPFDFVFIDGHHNKKATIDYFNKILPFLNKKAIIVIDDISWSDGMRQAWNIIKLSKEVKLSLQLGNIGICVKDSNLSKKQSYTIPFSKVISLKRNEVNEKIFALF